MHGRELNSHPQIFVALLNGDGGLNAAVRAVPMGAENTSPHDAVYASWQP